MEFNKLKSRLIIIVAVLLLLGGAVFFSFRQWNSTDVVRTEASNFTNAASRSPSVIKSVTDNIIRPFDDARKAADFGSIKSRPIDVTGTVIDQYDKPLANILIEFAIGSGGFYSSSQRVGKTNTDEFGNFRISGHEGSAIRIDPKVSGYTLVPTNNRIVFSGFDQNDPLFYLTGGTNRIIRMWKQQGPEPLISVSKSYKLQPGVPVFLDLLSSELASSGGDIRLTVIRPAGRISPTDRQDWRLVVEAVDGDLQEAEAMNSKFIFQAPTSGYKSKIVIERKSSDPKWSMQADVHLLVRSRNGRVYSKVGLSLIVNQEPELCWVGLQTLSNPNGSRNWEEDPRMITRIEGR